jgi:DNA-binding transcriptional regulator YiaG
VYERAALATFLLILMAVDRTMERWRMQMAASNKQQARDQVIAAQESTVKSEQTNTTPATQPAQANDIAQIIQAMQEMNAQNFAAMQAMNKETLNHFSQVTVELVRETVERTAATIAIQTPAQTALPAPSDTYQSEKSDMSNVSEGEQNGVSEGQTEALNLDAIAFGGEQNGGDEMVSQGEQDEQDYSDQIAAMYQQNNSIRVTDIVAALGCSRSTASKWLKRVKPVTA